MGDAAEAGNGSVASLLQHGLDKREMSPGLAETGEKGLTLPKHLTASQAASGTAWTSRRFLFVCRTVN